MQESHFVFENPSALGRMEADATFQLDKPELPVTTFGSDQNISNLMVPDQNGNGNGQVQLSVSNTEMSTGGNAVGFYSKHKKAIWIGGGVLGFLLLMMMLKR